MNLHYAIKDAFFTRLLYLADREKIKETFETCKYNMDEEDPWGEVIHALNIQMTDLSQRHMRKYGDWPEIIRSRPYKNRPSFDGLSVLHAEPEEKFGLLTILILSYMKIISPLREKNSTERKFVRDFEKLGSLIIFDKF